MRIIMMTLLTVSLLGGVVFTHAQDIDPNLASAENLLSLLTESENEVTSLFENIVDDGGEVPQDAQDILADGQELHSEAQALFDGENYEECIEKATEALNKYGEALEEVAVEEPEDPETGEPQVMAQETVEEQTAKMVGLNTAIAKARSRISQLGEIAETLEGVDTSAAIQLLDDAEDILDAIGVKLVLGEFDESEIILGRANRLIGQATGVLKNQGEPKKQEKILHFISQTSRRMEHLRVKMMKVFDKKGYSVTKINEYNIQFDDIKDGYTGLLTHGDLKLVIKDLKALVKESRKIGNGQSGLSVETVEALNEQTDLESLIDIYRSKVMELDESDEVKDELLAKLDEAAELLAQAEDALAAEDDVLAEELTDAVEEILKEFKEMFDDVVVAQVEAKSKGKSGDKFDDKLVEVNARIAEIEVVIDAMDDSDEKTGLGTRLLNIQGLVDEAVDDEDLDGVEELLEELEEELGIEKPHKNNDKNNGKGAKTDETESETPEPEDPEPN